MLPCKDCGGPIIGRGRGANRCLECAEKRERKQARDRYIADSRSDGERNFKKIRSFKNAAHLQQGDTCVMCGWTVPGMAYGGCVVHHIMPVADGGSSDANTNAAVLCPNCHVLEHRGILNEQMIRLSVDRAVRDRARISINMIDRVRAKIEA